MRNTPHFPVIFLLLAAGAITGASGAPSDLPARYDRWLNEEVIYIIASSERKQFLELESDAEREQFIRQFWQIRDPDLSTEANEYRVEHEARIAYANENFHSGIPGWKTDRGKVYIMHGPPDSINFSMGGERLLVRVRNPTEVLTEGLADRRNFFPVELDRPQSEVWVYTHLPTARSARSYFQIIFSRADPQQLYFLKDTMTRLGDGRGNYQERLARDIAIKQFQNSQSTSREMKILYAGEYRYQGIDDLFQSVFSPGLAPSFSRADLQGALKDLDTTPGEVLQENLRRERRLKEVVESRIFFEQFPISVSHRFLRDSSGNTLIPLTIGVDSAPPGETLEILIEMVRSGGERAALVVDSMMIGPGTEKAASKQYLYQSRVSVRPGSHSLRVYGYLSDRKAIATYETDLQVPDFSGQQLMVSDILLFDQALPRQKGLEQGQRPDYTSRFLGASAPVVLEDHVLIPATLNLFRRAQNLTLLFEVYNSGVTGEGDHPSLNLQCTLWQGDRLIAKIPQKQLDYFTRSDGSKGDGRRTTYGLSIPLRSLHPGDYRLELVVDDSVMQQSVTARTAFQVY